MKDIISVNRQFLILARERAKDKPADVSCDVVTGLTASVLNKIAQLDMEQIEELAQSEIGLFTLRISEKQIETILSDMREKKRTAYLLAASQTQKA